MKLKCGHPGKPSNLINGKCGTCDAAKSWRETANSLAKTPANVKLKQLIMVIAECFQRGDIVFDANGKILIQYSENQRRKMKA